MKRVEHLWPLYDERAAARTGRDRLEILMALITAPSFDPLYRAEVIEIPRGHELYVWECVVDGCGRVRSGGGKLCAAHRLTWVEQRDRGVSFAQFLASSVPGGAFTQAEDAAVCRVCPQRPADHQDLQLCQRHGARWVIFSRKAADRADFAAWIAEQQPYPGYGTCLVAVCPEFARTPLGLCRGHERRYKQAGRPGGAMLPGSWYQRFEQVDKQVPVAYRDRARFQRWCAADEALPRAAEINLLGLRPLVRAEIQWGMYVHARLPRPTRWDLGWIRALVNTCRKADAGSLVDLDVAECNQWVGGIVKEILHELRQVYFSPEESKQAGFLETRHFGVAFPHRTSHIDLTGIPQRWLRDLTWDHLARLLRSANRPCGAGPIDGLRRSAIELGGFLEIEAPGGGHDPHLLGGVHMEQFVADYRHRERDGLASLTVKRADGTPSIVTDVTRTVVFNGVRKLLREAMDAGATEQLGLAREFVIAAPTAGGMPVRKRRPFPDEVARALADEANLRRLAEVHDPTDSGVRDVWETTVLTGRRIGEVIKARFECIGRYGGLAMFWHDQTKVGNYDAAIRIPERLYDLLAERQRKTVDWYVARHGRPPTSDERAKLALFPSSTRNPDGTVSLTHQWFYSSFRPWLDELDLGHFVPHQARHTLATSLLRHGATLSHIRRYLGQISDRMAEHYIHLTSTDLENVLQHVWVAGPGAANPGELLAGSATPLTHQQAQALAIDLSRRSTPAEGGFCTFQPVVDGGACPWNLECHNCDKFVLSGADLLYWRRKREQWRILAEGAPDEATSRYLHDYFEPTARAIDGLEKALAGLGLLDQALALDLRKPQDYFQRVWTTAFRADQLAEAAIESDDELDRQQTGR